MRLITLNSTDKKIAFVFPGQGAQVIEMGKEIIENYPESKKIFERACKVLDFDLEALCNSQNEEINQTEFTQPALLAVSIAILKAVEEQGIQANYVAGLSLGEYCALVANGALELEEAVVLVRKRGRFMEEAAKNTNGAMAAVLGATEADLKEILNQVDGIVQIANFNSPVQLVISGEEKAVHEACQLLADRKIRAIPLNVSGAFHSSLMDEASNKLEEALKSVTIRDFSVPYVANVTAKMVTNHEDVKELLIAQVASSVRWEESIRLLIQQGVSTFIEIGPSKTLAGLIKKIDKLVRVISVENLAGLKALEEI